MKDNSKNIKAASRGLKIIVFYAALIIMGLIGLLWFARPTTSNIEKRTLTEFPKFTLASFWNGEYFKQIDTWYSDTYPLRESLISGNMGLETLYGIRSDQIVGETMVAEDIPDPVSVTAQTVETFEQQEEPQPEPAGETENEVLEDGTVTDLGEMQGNIYITDHCGYGLYYFSQAPADTFAASMNQIYANVKDKVNLYILVAPISASVMLDQTVLDDMGSSNEGKAIEYVYAQLDPGIHSVSVYDKLVAHNSEYLYFHTDHHWTQLGAYYAYQCFCEEKGIDYHNLEDFDTMVFEDFLGTFYSNSNQSPELATNPDTVYAYVPNGTNDMSMTTSNGQTYDWKIINDVSDYPSNSKYGAFTGGDNPFSYAHNPQISDGSSVLVIKDSMGNAFIPWLIDHYENTYWIDARYTSNTISQMVEDYGVQDVIYECSIYNGTTDAMLDRYLAIGQ